MSVLKILWVTHMHGANDDFILFQLDSPTFPHAKTQPFPSNRMFAGSTNRWYCTLGIKNKSPFTVEGQLNCLVSARSEPNHMFIAKDIDGKSNIYTTVDFNEIAPVAGNNEHFARTLFEYANNFDKHTCEERGDYQVGIRDGVTWVNSLLKYYGIPKSSRQKGGNRFIPHSMLFDSKLFKDPLTLPDIVLPINPNAPNPPGKPALEIGQELHIVKAGDWLSKIAMTYYGKMNLYQKIHTWTDQSNPGWNRKEIGPNPNLLKPGMRIIIPPESAII